MAGIDNSAILLKTDYQFKGPLTENYVLQQLRGQFEVEPRYYSDKNSEIDFVLQYGTEIIPVEAKGGEDKSAPSFKQLHCRRISPNTRCDFLKQRISQRRSDHKSPAVSCEKNQRTLISFTQPEGDDPPARFVYSAYVIPSDPPAPEISCLTELPGSGTLPSRNRA